MTTFSSPMRPRNGSRTTPSRRLAANPPAPQTTPSPATPAKRWPPGADVPADRTASGSSVMRHLPDGVHADPGGCGVRRRPSVVRCRERPCEERRHGRKEHTNPRPAQRHRGDPGPERSYAWRMPRRIRSGLAAAARQGWLGQPVAVAGTGAVAGLPLTVRTSVSTENVVLSLLVVVFAAAGLGGLWSGLLASALAFLAFDVLFLPPYGTLVVDDPQDWVSLAAFLAVALAVSALVGIIRRRQAEAERREQESRVLYELSSSLVAHGGLDDTLRSVARTVRSLFGLAGCAVVLADGDSLRVAARDGDVDGLDRALGRSPDGQLAGTLLSVRGPGLGTLDPGQVLAVPMQGGQGPVGALVVVAGGPSGPDGFGFGEPERRVLATFANQAALAVEQKQAEAERERTRSLEET